MAVKTGIRYVDSDTTLDRRSVEELISNISPGDTPVLTRMGGPAKYTPPVKADKLEWLSF